MSWTIVGVDCATQEANMGLAHSVLDDRGNLQVERVTLGTAGESPAALCADWLSRSQQFILALDAPLGWPRPLGRALSRHRAGQPLKGQADQLFRRATDSFVRARLRKLPMEVGADRIARTARAALELLEGIRALVGEPLPLTWRPGIESGAIEVYPAATLITRGITLRGYKGKTAAARKARASMLDRLGPEVKLGISRDLMIENDDLLDAMLCTVAGADFARGLCVPPPDPKRAAKEGWIWFRNSGQRELF